MPKFELNKLVRDKLRTEYELSGQKMVYKVLSKKEHKLAIIQKIVEEAKEINIDDDADEIASEIADIQQAIDDFIVLCGVDKQQVESKKQSKLDKKGGFSAGTFVQTIELKDDDKWVEYYRQRPDIFPES